MMQLIASMQKMTQRQYVTMLRLPELELICFTSCFIFAAGPGFR